MSSDWQAQLAQFGERLAQQEQVTQHDRARILCDAGHFEDALKALARASIGSDGALTVRCHYGLMKSACADGAFGRARDHATNVLRLTAADPAFRGLRALTQQRLELLKALQTPQELPQDILAAYAAWVDGLGAVPVLGTFSSYGIGRGSVMLNEAIELLKKAPSELDPREARERPSLITFLGYALAKVLSRAEFVRRVDLIVPVPADPARAAERGYSVQETIGKEMAAHLAIPTSSQVMRQTRATRKLRDLPAWARAGELAGTMELVQEKRHVIEGRVILLIDDVVTYGTHFQEAKRVLKAAGAAEVVACAIATGRDNLSPLES